VTDDELLALCLELPGAWPDSPWGDGVVAKVGGPPGKVFAFPGGGAVALKVTPEDGAELRAAYPDAVGDARYLSKRHWVRIVLDGPDTAERVPDDELRELVERSYALVVRGLPRAQRPAPPQG
jgi:predicted DNA-binding protein (MmcQ/YjbR family)